MEALMASYASGSSEPEDSPPPPPPPPQQPAGKKSRQNSSFKKEPAGLPPPPLDLLPTPISIDISSTTQGMRIRNFPHVEGNYALHVFIPVHIPSITMKPLALYLKKVASIVPGLYAVDVDIALSELCKDDQRLEQIFLGGEFHISLGRTVPIQVHQIDSIVSMLRQKFQSERRYWIEFKKWDAFVNDDQTRSFLSLEVREGGLSQITRQIRIVDEVYRLHGLPEFYKNARPHISLVWALGDISSTLKKATEEVDRYSIGGRSRQKHIFMSRFDGIVCKIGKKSYSVCKFIDQ